MHKAITAFFFVILLLAYPGAGLRIELGSAHAQELELSPEELEIINNMDLLDNLDLLEEDLEFFEDYAEIDQSGTIGDSDE